MVIHSSWKPSLELNQYVVENKDVWISDFVASGKSVDRISTPFPQSIYLFRKAGEAKVKIAGVFSDLGEGDCKRVYRAYDFTKGKVHALSEMKLNGVDTYENVLQLSKNEAGLLGEFKTSKVVLQTSYSGILTSSDGEKVYTLTKYCEEGDLSINIGKLSKDEILQIMKDLVDALLEFKAKKLIHHDIKPSNVLLYREKTTKKLRAKLGDLGLTSHATELKWQGDKKYYSPRKKAGGYSSFESDAWGVGYIFHLMVYGQIPIRSKNFCFIRALKAETAKECQERLLEFTKTIDKLIFGLMNADESKALNIEEAKMILETLQPSDIIS